jgi:hypothetical protein
MAGYQEGKDQYKRSLETIIEFYKPLIERAKIEGYEPGGTIADVKFLVDLLETKQMVIDFFVSRFVSSFLEKVLSKKRRL